MPLLYWPVLHFFAIFFFLHLPNSLSAGSSSGGYEDNKGKYIDKKKEVRSRRKGCWAGPRPCRPRKSRA